MASNFIQPAEVSPTSIPDDLLTVKGLHAVDFGMLTRHCGIYFLVLEGSVVYIGKSNHLISRLLTHLHEDSKTFDSVFFVHVPERALTTVEGAFIRTMKPPFNGKSGRPTKNDWRTVKALMWKELSEYHIQYKD